MKKNNRTNKISVMLTDEELAIVDKYLARYKITNRSHWFRETIIKHILKMTDEDYPTLFGENDMRR